MTRTVVGGPSVVFGLRWETIGFSPIFQNMGKSPGSHQVPSGDSQSMIPYTGNHPHPPREWEGGGRHGTCRKGEGAFPRKERSERSEGGGVSEANGANSI